MDIPEHFQNVWSFITGCISAYFDRQASMLLKGTDLQSESLMSIPFTGNVTMNTFLVRDDSSPIIQFLNQFYKYIARSMNVKL